MSIEEEPSAVALTFRSIRTGRADLRVNTAGIGAVVTLEVVQLR